MKVGIALHPLVMHYSCKRGMALQFLERYRGCNIGKETPLFTAGQFVSGNIHVYTNVYAWIKHSGSYLFLL